MNETEITKVIDDCFYDRQISEYGFTQDIDKEKLKECLMILASNQLRLENDIKRIRDEKIFENRNQVRMRNV